MQHSGHAGDIPEQPPCFRAPVNLVHVQKKSCSSSLHLAQESKFGRSLPELLFALSFLFVTSAAAESQAAKGFPKVLCTKQQLAFRREYKAQSVIQADALLFYI
jgi:hypothetical protein